jgi:hypothetical protein
MTIQITTHYLKRGQEASPGVRASALEVKPAVPLTRPSWEGLSEILIGILLSFVEKVWTLLSA